MKRTVLIALAAVALAVVAYAQMAPPSGTPGEGPMMPRMGPMPAAPAIAADAGYLYILRGNEIIKVNASNLEVVLSKRLPKPEPPPMPPAPEN